MDNQKLIEDIKYIKEIITNSTHYTNLSGVASILSGIVALIGSGLSGVILKQWMIVSSDNLTRVFDKLLVIWSLVFVISAVINIFFIRRRARRTGQPAWSRLAKLIVYSLGPSLIVGGFLTAFFVMQGKTMWVPPICMISYGLAVWSAGLFSIPQPRWLGIAFITTGMAALFLFTSYNLLMMAVTFGVYHIIYGFFLSLKQINS